MIRWVLPAIAISLGLHAGFLGIISTDQPDTPGNDAPLSSTLIVFDTPPALAVSAADGRDNDAAVATASASRTSAEDPLAPLLEPQPEPGPVTELENPQTPKVAEPAEVDPMQVATQPAAQAEARQDEAATGTVPIVPVPRAKPPLPDHVIARIAREETAAKAQAERNHKAERKAKAEARRKRQAERAAAAQAKSKAQTSNQASSSTSRARSQGRKGGASAGDKRAYARRVLSHIQRFKRYPSGTSASGVVRLAVSISGSGSLRSARVRGSSGHSALDQAAVATARAASPYPAPPGAGAFSFTVSLRYTR